MFFFICTWVLTLLFQLSILFSKLMKFKKKRITTLWNHTGCYYINEFKVFFFFIKNIPPFARKNTHPAPSPLLHIINNNQTLLADCSIWMWKEKNVVFRKKTKPREWIHKNTPPNKMRANRDKTHIINYYYIAKFFEIML